MPDFVLDHEPDGFARIKVIGVGGGGCNAVDSMFDLGLQYVEFYVINSDLQALKRSKCPNRIQIGSEMTRGRGCGASPELGERCMLDAKEEMVETLAGADIVFVTAGLGGGTGTGAAPVVAQIAKEMGILTVAVVTKPFKFEGPRRMKSAEDGLARLHEACDTMITINNERLLEHVGPKVPMQEAFKVADNVLAQAVTSISDLVVTPGLINVDFNDIQTIMGGKGGAVMGVGVGKGENRAAEAVKKATSSHLLDKIVIDGATGVLICITGGPDMSLLEVSEATQMVHECADPDAEIIFGAVVDETMSDQIRVTIIATGFAEEIQRQKFSQPAEKVAPAPSPATRSINAPPTTPQPKPSVVAQAPVQEKPVAAPEASQPALFDAMEEAPVAAAPAPPQTEAQQNSLRSTLEAMMAQQGGVDEKPQIRVAKSSPAPNGGTGIAPGGHPTVRPASSAHAAVVTKPTVAAADEPAPQVTLFDPQESEAPEANYETPAFLRRRRNLFGED
jgi:cell division protein FtsZ